MEEKVVKHRDLQDNEKALIAEVAEHADVVEILTLIVAEIPSTTNILVDYVLAKRQVKKP